jgi:hypothetical protein
MRASTSKDGGAFRSSERMNTLMQTCSLDIRSKIFATGVALWLVTTELLASWKQHLEHSSRLVNSY